MIDSILEAARQIMRQEGVAALTMQELARRLDLRAPSLYNYFASKMDIYDALFRLGFTLYAQHMEETIQGAQSWQEELRRTFEAYLTFAQHNPELYQLCFERPVPGFEPSAESLQASLDLLQASYQRAERLRLAIASDLPAQQIVDLLISMMHGITALHIANQPHLPLGEGRFGSLIPSAIAVLDKAWSQP
jgi:AcrR family transcriptional regulator